MFINCFDGYEPLFHYTSFESAIKILASRRLRFGVMNKMNDPDESFRQLFITRKGSVGNHIFLSIDDISTELQHYQQISFSCSTTKKVGFQLQNMWGNYADKGFGVCLVFDKMMIRDMHPRNYGRVRYFQNYNPSLTFQTCTDKKELCYYIKRHFKSIFFAKSEEWRSEQEFRIVKYNETVTNNYLDLHNCWESVLKCIIFTYAPYVPLDNSIFNSSSYKAISSLVHDKCLLLQKAKDLNGYDSLYDSFGNTKWGQVIIDSDIDI